MRANVDLTTPGRSDALAVHGRAQRKGTGKRKEPVDE